MRENEVKEVLFCCYFLFTGLMKTGGGESRAQF